jgi:hypothetical protein
MGIQKSMVGRYPSLSDGKTTCESPNIRSRFRLLTEPFGAEVGADQISFGVVLLGQSDAY